MYTLIMIIQLLGILLILAELVYIEYQPPSRQQSRLLLMIVALLINFVAYYLELGAHTKELAVQAVKMSYVGKAFIPFCMLLFVMEYCKVRLPNLVKTMLSIMHFTVMFLVLTCEHNTLYYTD